MTSSALPETLARPVWYTNQSDMVCLLRWVLWGGFVISLVDAIFAGRPQAIGIDFGPEMMCVSRITLMKKPPTPSTPYGDY
jgi:hypothetical protein